ncbi:Urease accessory protein UreF [hydrothermal vent metagenome]|uniref:Urease accessory protein UreF n=1 Tax=hydrothermal vent metagenome TaxID=652676 RepID=A0A3B0ZSK9_9ZZZZ
MKRNLSNPNWVLIIMDNVAQLRLLQLTSPALPIGSYMYSQGLEAAIEHGIINNETETESWLLGMLKHSLCYQDLPLFIRLYSAWQESDEIQLRYWTQQLLASRESAELRSEDRKVGRALAKVLSQQGVSCAAEWEHAEIVTLPTMFSLATVRWNIPLTAAMNGYLWTWLENQIAAAIKIIPLGQSAGLRLQSHGIANIPAVVEKSLQIQDNDIGFSAPSFAMLSAHHEVQYSRLFQS